ncbi:MAG: NAD(P)H-quinone oxidoreductase [Candidatus Eremiobacteraeota bacterium]|nr:NAD(P)H-quinone oxidoreductase [Candidatus Eremiobacteraeota bacterium]
MRAVIASHPGGPEVLSLVGELPIPVAAEDEVLIAVRAAGVSRADALQRAGNYPPPPGASSILGLDVAGTIAAVGNRVTGWRVGDRVCALCNGGGYAEFVAVAAGQVLPIPDGWSDVEAATLPENMFTVYDNVFRRARLLAGETFLVHGGTSGIGTTAIMLTKAFGARVFATAGSAEKVAACERLGAGSAFDYRTTDFVAAVREATGGEGVDVILDPVGGDYIPRDLDALALDGRIAVIGTMRGATAELHIGTLVHRRATLLGSSLRPRSDDQKAEIARELRARVWPLLPSRASIVPQVDSTFAPERADEAHRRLESSAHIGKIVLEFTE